MRRVIVLGCGYLGERMARRHLRLGDEVLCLVRGDASAEKLTAQGFNTQQIDLDQPHSIPHWHNALLYYFVPPAKQGITDLRVAHAIASFQEHGDPVRVLYISTTGVYGHCQGDWVNEERDVKPQSQRAQRRLDAEQRWQQWSEYHAGTLAILRVAGIYGPGQLPLERLRKGAPIVRPEQSPYSNRIHIDDLVEVCHATMERRSKFDLFNVSDGHPTTMADYFCQLAAHAGLQAPPLIDLEEAEVNLSAEMMGYMSESRRIDNSKMLRELNLDLRYPSLQEGLSACFAEP